MHGTKIRVGGSYYTVCIEKDVHFFDDKGRRQQLYGKFHYGEKKIYLDEDMHPEATAVVLMHELIHGLFSNAGIRDEQERDVDVIAHGMVQLIRDNPDLVAYVLNPKGKETVDNTIHTPELPLQASRTSKTEPEK